MSLPNSCHNTGEPLSQTPIPRARKPQLHLSPTAKIVVVRQGHFLRPRGGLQHQGEAGGEKSLWLSHRPSDGNLFVSCTWRPTRTRIRPQILLRRLTIDYELETFLSECWRDIGRWASGRLGDEIHRSTRKRGFEGARGGMYAVSRRAFKRQISSLINGRLPGIVTASLDAAAIHAVACPACPSPPPATRLTAMSGAGNG